MTNQNELKYSLMTILKETLDGRKLKNLSYSLRAMARDLQVSPSTLSKLMNGKYSASDQMIVEIVENLNLSFEVKQRVIFFERCRKLSEFLNIPSGSGNSQSLYDKKTHRYPKSIVLDKNLFPDVLFYLKIMTEGFFTAVESLSSSKDSVLYLDNIFDIDLNESINTQLSVKTNHSC